MNADKNSGPLNSEQRHGTGQTTPPRGRQTRISGKVEELAAVSPLLQQLGRQAPPDLSARQWREFSMDLANKLDRELEGKSPRKLSEKLRDQVSATDSKVLRAAIVAFAIVLLAMLTFVTWLFTTSSGQTLLDDSATPLLTSLMAAGRTLATV